MLPLIAGIGSKLLSPGKTEDKNLAASKKKIKTEKFFDKKDKGGALVKTDSTKVKIKPSSALVKYQAPEKPKDKISDLSTSERKKSTGDELQNIIDEVKKLKSGLVKVRGLLAERKNSDLQSLVESRKALQIEKKKRREDELEKKKPKDEKSGISLPKPKFSFFDSIINFFTSILIGSLLNFLLANKNTIFKAFDDISKRFNNIFDVMRYSIISLTTTMPKLIKSLANFGKQVFRGPAKLTGNLLKKLGSSIKNLLVRTGKALGSFVSGTFKNLRGLAGGAGTCCN
jgi:regulator of replication initiation timing